MTSRLEMERLVDEAWRAANSSLGDAALAALREALLENSRGAGTARVAVTPNPTGLSFVVDSEYDDPFRVLGFHAVAMANHLVLRHKDGRVVEWKARIPAGCPGYLDPKQVAALIDAEYKDVK